MKDVSIIIINYNTAKFTLECIASIIKLTDKGIDYEIIVIDNNSEIENFDYLKNQIPSSNNIHLHRSIINTGFGGGNMLGVQFASGKYLLFLNNDALLLNDALSIIKNYMDQHTLVGLAGAQNYDQNNKHVPSFDYHKSLYRLVFGRGLLEKSNPEKYHNRKSTFTDAITVDWVTGSFLFFRAKAFYEIGGFDTNIFLYFEEMDVCHRLENQNYSTVLVPSAKILHYMSESTGSSKTINIEAFISHLYVIKKHYSFLHYNLMRLYYVFIFLFKPKKWYLMKYAIRGQNLLYSLKQKQQLRP